MKQKREKTPKTEQPASESSGASECTGAWKTSATLLGACKNGDVKAWFEFCRRYVPLVVAFGRRLGLSKENAEDLAQETMIDLSRLMQRPDWNHDKAKWHGFRALVQLIAKRKVWKVWTREQRQPQGDSFDEEVTEGHSLAEKVADGGTPMPSEEVDRHWEQALVEEALRHVAKEISKESMAIFKCRVLEQRPSAEVAKLFGTSVNNVDVTKHRVEKAVRVELRQMLTDLGELD